jgi:serine/threonine protein phosphatase 1
MRTFVIGDIHGGLKALVQVLNQIEVTAKNTFIFMGDYVDGWSESAQVIEFFMSVKVFSINQLINQSNQLILLYD